MWLDAARGYSGSIRTWQTYRDVLASARSALQVVGLDLDSADREAVALVLERWAGSRSPRSRHSGEISPATFNQRVIIVSSFYRFAMRVGWIVADPCELIQRRRVQPYATVEPLEREKVALALRSIDTITLPGKRDLALLLVALTTGRRSSELVGLRWGDVRVNAGTTVVQWRRIKGGKTARDILASGVAQVLGEYVEALGGGPRPAMSPLWVALSGRRCGGALTRHGIRYIVKKHLGTTRIHALRHTFARDMEEAGAKVSEIQRRLGHTNLSTTSRYLEQLLSADNPYADSVARSYLRAIDG
jgi:integrase/recombinase XerD